MKPKLNLIRSCLFAPVIAFGCVCGILEGHAALIETHYPDPVLVGGKLTFTFTLSDLGTSPGVFSNALPSNTVFVSATVTNGAFAVSNNVFVYIPTISEAVQTIVFGMVLTPVTAQIITNIAYWIPAIGSIESAGSTIPVASVRAGPELVVGRANHQSTRLQDGRILISGGLAAAGGYMAVTATAEVYSAADDRFSLVGQMGSPRQYHTATLLPNGMVLVAGGEVGIWLATNTADLFDPAADRFVSVPGLALPRAHHSATLLSNGDVIFAGGGGTNTLIERFSLTGGQGTISVAGHLLVPRSGHVAALLPSGEILFAGGTDDSHPFAERFDPQTGASAIVVPEGHIVPAVAVAQGKVLLHGWTVQPHFGAELYDIESNTFASLPDAPSPTSYAHYLTLSTGEVLISAGLYSFEVKLFNPRTGLFRSSYPVNVTRESHSAVELADGRVLLTGGYDLIGTMSGDMKTTELYALRLDLDQDGMDDAWELAHGFDPANRGDAIEDADGDGHTNLQEYLAGTDPRDPTSVLRFVSIQREENSLRLRFSSVLGKYYRVQRIGPSPDNWVDVAGILAGTGRAIEVSDAFRSGGTSQMYRVLLLP